MGWIVGGFWNALRLTFERRGTHDLPASLIPPPADWQIPFRALAEECGLPAMSPRCLREYKSFSKKCWHSAPSGKRGMTENDSESLPFEPPEQENIRLREENARLRRLLAVHSIPIPQLAPENPPPTKAVEPPPPVDKEERARKRIALFRSLFRGREDVYARRWENDDGRHGYVPAAREGLEGHQQKPPGGSKKVDQKTRKFLPMTDAVIENHLLGKETIGVYPLLPDETCWFLAADFDKKTWEYDSLAFLETCQELNVPAALERSRSGKGGHIWIFFDRALPAITARKLGCVLLTRTMERRHQVGLDSYDRFFPNQDTMPKGGFGNLIALPLQFAPRKLGNSVFIDADVRTGDEAGEGQVCRRPDCYADPEGRTPSDHLHAVWPRTVQHERPDDDRNDALRAQGDSPPYGVPDGA